MSEAQKPVEEVPAAVPATAPAAEPTPAPEAPAPAVESTPADAPATEATKETPAAEEPAKEEVKEVTPATDGVLGYKAPGLVRGLRFSKRFFWFSDDAVEIKSLNSYFQNEKLSVAHPTAAWASQTGKGLIFFAKRAEDKAAPTGIINLAEISEIGKEAGNEFSFKWNGHKHTFQAGTTGEKAAWIAAIEAKSTQGKAEKEGIITSDGYKAELEKLTKPAVAPAPASPKKTTEDKGKEAAKKDEPEGEDKKSEEKKPEEKKDEDKKKSRSQSRKRASIFGTILGKKDEGETKKEEKKEEKPEEAKKADTEAAPAEAAAPAAEPAATPAETATEATPAEEPKPEEKKEAGTPTATKNKRASIFGNFFQKVATPGHSNEKAEKETAKAETPAVSSTAPQLGDPVDPSTSEPIKPETVTEASKEPAKEEEVASPSSSKGGFLNFIKKDNKQEAKKEVKPEEKSDKKPEEETPAEEPATSPEASGAIKDKRRTSFFGNFGTKKEKKAETPEAEPTEGESKDSKARTSSLPRLGGLFRKPSKAVKKEKEPAVAPTEQEPIPEGTDKPEAEQKKEETPAAEPTATVNGTESEDKDKATETPAAPAAPAVQAAA